MKHERTVDRPRGFEWLERLYSICLSEAIELFGKIGESLMDILGGHKGHIAVVKPGADRFADQSVVALNQLASFPPASRDSKLQLLPSCNIRSENNGLKFSLRRYEGVRDRRATLKEMDDVRPIYMEMPNWRIASQQIIDTRESGSIGLIWTDWSYGFGRIGTSEVSAFRMRLQIQ